MICSPAPGWLRSGLKDVFLIGWMIGASFDGIAASGAQVVIAELPPGSFRMKDWQALDDSWKKHEPRLGRN